MPNVPPPQPPPVPHTLPQKRSRGIIAAFLDMLTPEPLPKSIPTLANSYFQDALARIALAEDAATLLGELSRLPAFSEFDWSLGQKAVQRRMRELGIV